jgi:sugar lactone lactonase YvrE
VLEGVTVSNGLGWSPERDRMYHVDTHEGGLDVFDYEEATGEVRGRRRLLDVPPELGVPDGPTVDAEGHVWLSIHGGSSVRRYSPTGRLERIVELPVSQVTSCTFGGPDLGDLYITTASEDFTPEQREREPHAGGIFRCTPGEKGLPGHEFAG